MKKVIRLLIAIMMIMLFIGGCGTLDNGVNTGDKTPDTNADTDVNDKEAAPAFEAEVIEAGDHLLVTPDKDSSEYKSSDKISVGLTDAVITDKNGKKITLADLKAGDRIKITYNGVIAESYPAQISASEIEVTGHNVLIDGYLALIDDIYQEDSGLNGDITTIGLDTTGWVELTDIEKEIIFAEMKNTYGFEIAEGTSDELAEQGLIDKENLSFPKGILITISDMKYDKDKEEITCSIAKWRSGDGAVGSDNVTATYKDEKWTIKKDGRWIS